MWARAWISRSERWRKRWPRPRATEAKSLWNTSKPDGTPKKQLDVSRLAALGCRARIPLAQGLASTVAEFREQLSQQLLRL